MIIEHYNDSYLNYCKFLQDKYGIPAGPYFVRDKKGGLKKNTKITRGKEGLYIHHIKENELDMLCNAKYCLLKEELTKGKSTGEWHEAENLCYCNLLEHYLLHLLIEKDGYRPYGTSGGIFQFIGPELNDLYSGFESNYTARTMWRKAARDLIIDYKDEYISVVKKFIRDSGLNPDWFKNSFNAQFGTWNSAANTLLYEEFNDKE